MYYYILDKVQVNNQKINAINQGIDSYLYVFYFVLLVINYSSLNLI